MQSVVRNGLICAAFGFLLATAACGGGGSGASGSIPSNMTMTGSAVNGSAVMVIPNRTTASTARHSQYLSAAAVSVGISVNEATATFSDISSSSPLCTASTTGRTCTVPLAAFPGTAAFVFTFYDGANGTGNKLGSGTASLTIVAGTPFKLPVAVTGIAASIAVSVPVIEAGPTSVPVTVVVKDADNNTIIGPVPYGAPITLANSDTTGTLTLSTTTMTAPGDPVTLTYTGGALASAATISATGAGVAATNSAAATVLPLNYFPQNLSRTYAERQSFSETITPIGTPSSLPTPYPSSQQSTTYTTAILGGGTYNGFAGVQVLNATENSFSIGGTYGNYSGYSTYYQQLEGANFVLVGAQGTNLFDPSYIATVTYPSPLVLAALPFVPGPTIQISQQWNRTEHYSSGSGTGTSTASGDALGNQVFTDAYTDGSTRTLHYNADSSATATYTAGTTCAGSYYDNNLACADASATATYSSPSSGTVTIQVSGTSTGGATQTASLALPANALYPTGLPAGEASYTVTIGAPVTTLPAACAVTAAYPGPIVPVTYVSTYGNPDFAGLKNDTEIDYLAPSIGPVCVTLNESTQNTYLPTAFDFTSPTLTPPTALYTDTYVLVDSLTSVGPPLQSGSITTTGRARHAVARTALSTRDQERLLHRPAAMYSAGSAH